MMRPSRSNTISSIGRRSKLTKPELMIFWMPLLVSASAGPSSKPSRLSISAWFSTRAASPAGASAGSGSLVASAASVVAPQAAARSSSVPLIAPAAP